jgi:hypothetical protein
MSYCSKMGSISFPFSLSLRRMRLTFLDKAVFLGSNLCKVKKGIILPMIDLSPGNCQGSKVKGNQGAYFTTTGGAFIKPPYCLCSEGRSFLKF